MSLKINYPGHSCFCIQKDEDVILIDPFISQNPKAKVTFDINKTKYIFLTHAHSDHLGDAIEISKKTGAVIFAVFELANYCAKKGAVSSGVGLGGELKFNFGKVKFLPAFHSSSTSDGFYAGCPASILFDFDDYKIYHAGDTCLTNEMKLVGELYKPDIAMLPIGGHFTMNYEDAATAAKWLGSKTIIPMHYNTFDLINVNLSEFINLIEYTGQNCKEMYPGDEFELL